MKVHLVVARENDKTFANCIAPSAQRLKMNCFQVGDAPDKNGNISKRSITEKYYMITDKLRSNNELNDNTLIVYSHEDVNIVDNLFIDKITALFTQKPEIGIMGVVGVETLNKEGWWLDAKNKPIGHIVKGIDGKNINEGKYIKFGNVGYFDNIVGIESSLFVVRGSLLNKINFDIKNFSKDRNMHVIDLCIQALQEGYRVCVGDVLIYHKSNRNDTMNEEWKRSLEIFNKKYINLQFPINVDNLLSHGDEMMEVEI